MDLGRLRGTDYVVGGLAAALLGSLFLPWYRYPIGFLQQGGEVEYTYAESSGTANAWEIYAVTDVVLAVIAVMALGIVFLTASQRTSAVPVAWTALTAAVSLVATGFVVVAALGTPSDELAREVGPTVGLALTLALTGAVWSGMRSERPGPALARSPRAEVETLSTPQP